MNQLYKKILCINHLPKFVKILCIIIINWTFQSILYMDKTEKAFKIVLELVFLGIMIYLLSILNSVYYTLILAIIISHTLNWTLNGHVFALLKTFGFIKTKKDKFLNYSERLKSKALKNNSIAQVSLIGSLVRNEIKETSDLDIRIIRKNGIFNGLSASFFVFNERTWAFFHGFPLDIYVYDDKKRLLELKEEPEIIYSEI